MSEVTKIVSNGVDIQGIANKKATEMREHFKNQPKEEEEEIVEEPVEESDEEIDEEVEEEMAEEQPEEESEMTDRERGLLKEVTRLKAERRETRIEQSLGEVISTTEESEDVEVTKAEARLFTAWRNEALSELLKKYPKYKTDPKLWKSFVEEFEDRVPDLEYAKKKNMQITKDFFVDRLERIHKSVYDESSKAKEEGKREALKSATNAQLMSAGAHSGQKQEPKQQAKKPIYIKQGDSLTAWLSKKNN